MKVSFCDLGLIGFVRMGEFPGYMWKLVYERPEGPFDICYGISGAYIPRRERERERNRD